jgi:hypothetical protein
METFVRKQNGIAEDLGAIIGLTNALLLCGIRGGSNLYIPKQVTEGHVLWAMIGEAAFSALVDEYGGQSITIPALAEFGRYQRIRKCADILNAGGTIHSASKVVGVTPNQVKNYVRTAVLLGLICNRRLQECKQLGGSQLDLPF